MLIEKSCKNGLQAMPISPPIPHCTTSGVDSVLLGDPAAWWDNRGSKAKKSQVLCPQQLQVTIEISQAGKQGFRTAHRIEVKVVGQIVAALKGCSKVRDLEGGKKLHRDAVEAGLNTNNYVAAALITMYSKCRSMLLAQEVFDGMIHRDTVTWNSLILGYVQNGKSLEAMDLVTRMDCKPNRVTYVTALKACASLAMDNESQKQFCLKKGIAIHKEAKQRGFLSDIVLASTLLDMYSKCGSMDCAREVFDRMESKNVVAWSTLILGYVQNGKSRVALGLFTSMDCEADSIAFTAALKACAALASEEHSQKRFCLEKGIAIHKQVSKRGLGVDIFLGSTLVDMYSKCGNMDCAREVFDSMIDKDVVTWTSLIMGYANNGQGSVALDLFSHMNCNANAVAYTAALKACGGLAAEEESKKQFCLEKGIAIHKQAQNCGLDSDITLANALVDMYSKCGCMSLAREVFDKMTFKTVVAWNSLIQGYAQNQQSLVALNLFSSMDCEPDSITCLAALKACGGLGLEKQSEKQLCLEKVIEIHKRAGDRCDLFVGSSLVDIYSKCGSMQRAREVFDNMVLKDVVTWNSLISGYLQNGNSLVAMDLFAAMDCEPDPLTYVTALQACGNSAALPEGQQIHARLCKLGLEQDPQVGTTLMDFYGKCGSMSRAEELFNNMQAPDLVSWNALVTGFSSSGDSSQVFSLLKQMQEAGLKMDAVSFMSILAACSHAGMVEEGRLYFDSMLRSGPRFSLEHYNCMVDLLGRANKLQEALALINNMPFEANSVTWRTLLGACRKWNNLKVGKVAFDALMRAGETGDADEQQGGAAYVLMSDLYGSLGGSGVEESASL